MSLELFIPLSSFMNKSPSSEGAWQEPVSDVASAVMSPPVGSNTVSPPPEDSKHKFDHEKLTHSHIAELSEAFRMLSAFGNAVSRPTALVAPPSTDLTATMTATMTALSHQHTLSETASPAGAGLSSPQSAGMVSPGMSSGAGNAAVVNHLTTEQLASILQHLGVSGGSGNQAGSLVSPASPSPQKPKGGDFPTTLIDTEFGGRLNFSTFLALMLKTMDKSELEDMKSAFRMYDKDNTGYVTSQQFCEMCASMGEKSSPEELSEMMMMADPEDTGRIDYSAFLTGLWQNVAE